MALATLVGAGGFFGTDSLRAIFRAAVEWNAILLLDEADVVLEARSFEDVHRNASVSSEPISNHLKVIRSLSNTLVI